MRAPERMMLRRQRGLGLRMKLIGGPSRSASATVGQLSDEEAEEGGESERTNGAGRNGADEREQGA